MKIHELEIGKKQSRKRLGRGIGSGKGKTAGRGTKGQNSRSGGGVSIGFEGGQTKLAHRLPKARGFKSQNPTNYQVINIEDLAKIKQAKITADILYKAGLISKIRQPVKLLSDGAIERKVNIAVQAASKSAIEKIKSAGGEVQLTPLSQRQKATAEKKTKAN